jgi:hypothetical protein
MHTQNPGRPQARRTVREKRKADMTADLDERVGKLKEKLHVS